MRKRRRRTQRGRGVATDLIGKAIGYIPTVLGAGDAVLGLGNGFIANKYGLGNTVGSGKSVLEFLWAKKHGLI